MTETPSAGANPATTTPTPTGEGATGNPADAAPVESNPTDSSAVSDDQVARSDEYQEQEAELQAKRDEVAADNAVHQERVAVDHEGTGPGDEPAPPSNVQESDGTETA